jgi:hypothetical protein
VLQDYGFELLKNIDLDEQQIEAVARQTRGGTWGRGAYAISGGPPEKLVFALDLVPSPVPSQYTQSYPYLDNGRVLLAKLAVRELIRKQLPRESQFNPLHATDDSVEAWKIVRLFAPEEECALRGTIDRRRAAFKTSDRVIRDLTRTGVRAKVELIRYGSGTAIKKTWQPNCLRFMQREAEFMDAMSPLRPEILPVLERGANYLIMPFVEGKPPRRVLFGRTFPRLLTIRQITQFRDLLLFLFSRGYDPVDLAPYNLLIDSGGNLKVIDFEFVYRSERPIDVSSAACLYGIPPDFKGDPPKPFTSHRDPTKDQWQLTWFGCTGLTRESFLHDPPAVQQLKRLLNYPSFLATKAFEHQSAWVRVRAKAALKRSFPGLSRLVRGILAVT